MGRLVLGRPGPVTHEEERGKKREKREKEERKKEGERKEKEKRGEKKGKKTRPIWAGYSVFRLCTSLYQALNTVLQLGIRPLVGQHITDIGS